MLETGAGRLKVDGHDYIVWRYAFGNAAATAVPETASAHLLVSG